MRYPGLSHEARRHCCHRLFLSSSPAKWLPKTAPKSSSAVKAAVRQEPGAEAHEVTARAGAAGAGLRQARRHSDEHGQSGGGIRGLATSPLVARGHPGPVLSAAGCLHGAAVQASRRRAATLRQQGGGVGGRSAAKFNEAAQRGQASSRSPATRTWPTRSRRCRGSRVEMADRFTVVVAIRGPQAEGSTWGQRPRPKPSGLGKRVKSGAALTVSPNASSVPG